MSNQIPSAIVMVRPSTFGYNEQTAETNAFQEPVTDESKEAVLRHARAEFDALVASLQSAGIVVYVFDESPKDRTPDALFPNNWISMMPDGTVVLYPMMAPNRRLERRKDVIDTIEKDFVVGRVQDYSHLEQQNVFLESTGSVVFDHDHKTAYANQSPRTDKELFYQLCRLFKYEPVWFVATDRHGQDIYHTNVMMSLGRDFAVVCTEAIEENQREAMRSRLRGTGRALIEISHTQMEQFAANIIQVNNAEGKPHIIMSQSAYDAFTPAHRVSLAAFGRLLPGDISSIERYGGGSVRCMIAGIHLPARAH
jgi:hypothetical protein